MTEYPTNPITGKPRLGFILGFFVITQTLFAILSAAFSYMNLNLYSLIDPSQGHASTLQQLNLIDSISRTFIYQHWKTQISVVILIELALSLVSGFLLLTKFKRSSVTISIAVLWVKRLIPIIVYFMTEPTLRYLLQQFGLELNSGMLFLQTVGNTIIGIVWAVFWTIYFLKSKRVKANYPKTIDTVDVSNDK